MDTQESDSQSSNYPGRNHGPTIVQPRRARPRMRREAQPKRRLHRPFSPRMPIGIKPGCVLFVILAILLLSASAFYLLYPSRTNVLILGIDYTDPGSNVGRSDTIILATIEPFKPYIGLLSIPRDLWVLIPGVGENRINTAHYYAEIQQPGSGPAAAIQTIALNFGVYAPYYIRIRFQGFRDIVDAFGGIDVYLKEPMAGYPAGKIHLTGKKALAFVRFRQGADDFYRMGNGQFMLTALIKNMLNPFKWFRLPAVIHAFSDSIDTNLPLWLWPRLGFALLRVGPNGIDNHIISHQMVTDFTTSEGASVLSPNWDLINPIVRKIFGQ
jgi:LCP family protein required for cell wall assembly